MDDTLNCYENISPSLTTDPKITSIAARGGRNAFCKFAELHKATGINVEAMTDAIKSEYIELQYHGELTAECIESVVFGCIEDAKGAKGAIKKLLDLNIPCYIHEETKKHATRITEKLFMTL